MTRSDREGCAVVEQEQVLVRAGWAGVAPQAFRNLVWAVVVGVVVAVADGSLGAAALSAAILFALSLSVDAFGWWQLRQTGYAVVERSLVVRGRRWSQSYPLAEVERADVIGAATWRRTVLRLSGSISSAYPVVRLQVRGRPVWGPPVAVWGAEGAAGLQRSLDAVLAARQRP